MMRYWPTVRVITSILAFSLVSDLRPAEALQLHRRFDSQHGYLIAQQLDIENLEQPEFALGDEGPLVKQLQYYLVQLGYYQGDVTGRFDEATRQSLLQFQAAEGLPADGISDKASWDRLIAAQNPTTEPISEAVSATSASENQGSPLGNSFILVVMAGVILGLVGMAGVVLWLMRRSKSAGSRSEDVAQNYASDPLGQEADTLLSESERVTSRSSYAELSNNPVTTENPVTLVVSDQDALNQPWMPSRYEVPIVNIVESQAESQVESRDTNGDITRLSKLDLVETLIADLQDSDTTKRRRAIWQLGEQADSRAVRPLVNLITHSDSKQHSLILAALAEIGMNTLKPMQRALAMSLQHESPEVRKNAIRDLIRIYDLVIQTSQILSYAAEDSDPEVRETAAWALDQLKGLRSLTVLEPDRPMRRSNSFPEDADL